MCLSGNPPNFVFLLCACSSVVAMWKINSLSEDVVHTGLPGVLHLTGPCGFLVEGPVDDSTQNWTSESPVFYPVFI